LNKATQAWQIWLKLNAYIDGSQAFAKLFEQPSYILDSNKEWRTSLNLMHYLKHFPFISIQKQMFNILSSHIDMKFFQKFSILYLKSPNIEFLYKSIKLFLHE